MDCMPASTYGVDPATRRFIRGVALLLPAIAFIGTVGQLTGLIRRSLDPMGFIFFDAGFAGLAWFIWQRAGRRVIIDEDSIQVTGWLASRTLRRDEILGRHMRRGYRLTYFYVIVPRDRERGELKLPPYLKIDAHFHDWMRSIPKIRE
jgi:hypothetical protein